MWKRREKRIPERFGAVVVCKDRDKAAFGIPDRTFVVGNGFERLPLARKSGEELLRTPRLGIIGNFHYRLNTDATEWFLSRVWDSVRAQIPNATLRLVGRGGESYANAAKGIEALGFIDDPAEELSSWSALLAPTRMGGGTSVKIAEAFARKIPVVATTHGVRGYGVETGRAILVADNPQDFANACLDLLRDPSKGASLAEIAHQYFDCNLAWETMLPQVKGAIGSVSPRLTISPASSIVS